MYEVLNGRRTIKFDGQLLAASTSYRPNSDRWIEFYLYRTIGGSYVLSRVGETRLYHTPACPVVKRNGLTTIPLPALRDESIPCKICRPDRAETDMVAPEMPRYWAQVADNADAVVDHLYKQDEQGARYMTIVAERLLEEAAEIDPQIEKAYRVETIF